MLRCCIYSGREMREKRKIKKEGFIFLSFLAFYWGHGIGLAAGFP